MSNLQKFWLVFGPFHTPLEDEAAYCYDCISEGPKYYTDDVVSVDESIHCRLMIEADEEPGPNFFDKMSVTASGLLGAHAKSIEEGGDGEPSVLFLLPTNFYEQDD